MNIEEFNNNIINYINVAKSLADELCSIELTNTKKSLKDIDKLALYIQDVNKKGLIKENDIWNISVCVGVLIGEILLNDGLKNKGYIWYINENDLPVLKSEKQKCEISPVTKLYRLMTCKDGSEIKITEFYNTFKEVENYSKKSNIDIKVGGEYYEIHYWR